MKITKEQAMAYTEVVEILKYVPKEEKNKIPKEIIEYYMDNRDISYSFKIDIEKSFEEQALLEKTKIVLAILFRDYWATPEQKERILSKQNYDRIRIETDKRNKYNPNDIFKNRIEENTEMADKNNLPIEVKKNNFFKKIIHYIRNLFIYK